MVLSPFIHTDETTPKKGTELDHATDAVPRLSVAGKLISLVAKEIAFSSQLFAESIAGTVQTNLDCIEADTEDFGNLAVLESLQFAQHRYGLLSTVTVL